MNSTESNASIREKFYCELYSVMENTISRASLLLKILILVYISYNKCLHALSKVFTATLAISDVRYASIYDNLVATYTYKSTRNEVSWNTTYTCLYVKSFSMVNSRCSHFIFFHAKVGCTWPGPIYINSCSPINQSRFTWRFTIFHRSVVIWRVNNYILRKRTLSVFIWPGNQCLCPFCFVHFATGHIHSHCSYFPTTRYGCS